MEKYNWDYKFVATSRSGFVQQVACSYVCRGYRYHVSGSIPERIEPADFDEKMLTKYGIRKTEGQRYYAKSVGRANVQYIRFGRDWLMLATDGDHLWHECEAGNRRDHSRGEPINFQGYAIYLKDGLYRPFCCKRDRTGAPERDDKKRVRVQIARKPFKELKAEFLALANKRNVGWLAGKIYSVPYEPYAPVRQQMLEILHAVNRKRKKQGLKTKISASVIRTHRKIVKPFEVEEVAHSEAA